VQLAAHEALGCALRASAAPNDPGVAARSRAGVTALPVAERERNRRTPATTHR
jgi:hypothetical protein